VKQLEVIVLVKSVRDQDYLKYDVEHRRLIFDDAPVRMSQFDRSAVEEAVRLKEKFGGGVKVLTFGEASAAETVREALAMGCDSGYLVSDPSVNAIDTLFTSFLLSKAISKLGSFDIVICGEASSDSYTSLVGPSVAEWLGISHIAYARKLSKHDDKIVAERILETNIEIVEATMPLLVTVINEINTPRLPTVLQNIAARKKPLTRMSFDELGMTSADFAVLQSGIDVVETAPIVGVARKRVKIQGHVDDSVDALLTYLRNEGLVN
jgi:electron transfer flavoprotein beta subunit